MINSNELNKFQTICGKINFIKNYQSHINTTFQDTELNKNDMDNETEHLYTILKSCASAAYHQTKQSTKYDFQPKIWWTDELSKYKKNLSFFYNSWKEDGFSYHSENVHYNRYKLARKTFSKAVKTAQNVSLSKYYIKHDQLKRSNPQKFWSKFRQLKKPANKKKIIHHQ